MWRYSWLMHFLSAVIFLTVFNYMDIKLWMNVVMRSYIMIFPQIHSQLKRLPINYDNMLLNIFFRRFHFRPLSFTTKPLAHINELINY